MIRNRRSFLKAALGCATALVVPGVLPQIVPKPKPEVKLTSWYKPGIWAMPNTVDLKLIPGTLIVMKTDDVVYLKMAVDGTWKDVHSSKRFLER